MRRIQSQETLVLAYLLEIVAFKFAQISHKSNHCKNISDKRPSVMSRDSVPHERRENTPPFARGNFFCIKLSFAKIYESENERQVVKDCNGSNGSRKKWNIYIFLTQIMNFQKKKLDFDDNNFSTLWLFVIKF